MMTSSHEPINPINRALIHQNTGLTKREYFAAMAMQGILARGDNYPYESRQDFLTSMTSISVELADQLITQLNQTK